MKINVNGVNIFDSVDVNKCWYTTNIEKETDELIIIFNDSQNDWDSWGLSQNAEISVEHDGIATGAMFVNSLQRSNGKFTVRARNVPRTMFDKRTKTWNQIFLLQIAQEIASRHNLTLSTYGVSNIKYEYAQQSNKSDLAYLQERCLFEGLAFTVYNKQLILFSYDEIEAQTATEFQLISEMAYEFEDYSTELYKSLELTNGAYTGTATATNDSQKEASTRTDTLINNQAEANRYAQNALSYYNKQCTEGYIVIPYLENSFASGSMMKLTMSNTSFDGNVFITRVRHDLAKLTTSIWFRRV